MNYTKIIIGAGLYGLYSALYCAKKNENVLVLEMDAAPFQRATYINQARVHMGYHYPRSYSTAIKSSNYFNKFNEDFPSCILSEFDQIYATSANFSWTDAPQFQKFCKAADIRCEEVPVSKYFKVGTCDGCFLTTEYTYDAEILKQFYLEQLDPLENVHIVYNAKIKDIVKGKELYSIVLENGEQYSSSFILNATYASVNQILNKLGYEPFIIKYELCEIILCSINKKFEKTGITVMDGPFFSIMPFGKTGYHSLTSVTFTPHMTSYDSLPTFECQNRVNNACSPQQLGNCNDCLAHPKSAWSYMSNLAKKYLKDEFEFEYVKSLYSMKPILKASEIDDSRPTVIKYFSKNPTFVSVLSGKINTVYDLEEVLNDDIK